MSAPKIDFPEYADPRLAPFWDRVRAGKVVMQRFTQCGYRRWPPGPRCSESLASGTAWDEAASTGTLVSYATYYRAFNKATEGEVPYTVAYVRLDDGPRIYGRLLPDASGAKCDAPVQAAFHEVAGIPYIGWQLQRPSDS